MPRCPVCDREVPDGGSCPEHEVPGDALLGSVLAGSYRVERVLGQGGMGRVYAGDDVRLGRRVAIKTILPGVESEEQALRRFEREARAVAALDHPHIVTVHDVGELEDGTVYLVMGYLEGESLHDRIERQKRLPLADAAGIVGQVARALRAAHDRGLVHRDLKPGNVLLVERDGRDDFVKLLDFGLAKPVHGSEDAATVTQAGMAIGTPHYMSPEQCRGKEVDRRADIYALGMLAYAMVCGRPAFLGLPHVVIVSQVTDPPPDPRGLCPDLPDAAAAALLKALAKRRGDRFDQANAFAEAFARGLFETSAEARAVLQTADESLPAGAPEPAVPPDAGRATRALAGAEGTSPSTLTAAAAEAMPSGEAGARRSRPLRLALGVAGVVALGALAAVLLGRGQPPQTRPPSAPKARAAGADETSPVPATAASHGPDAGAGPDAGVHPPPAASRPPRPAVEPRPRRKTVGARAGPRPKPRPKPPRSRPKRPMEFDLDL